MLLGAFVVVERRAARPLVPPHTWKVRSLVSGTAVMLGVMGLLVGTVFLCSVFFQVVLGYSAVMAGVAFLPLAFAITAGTHVAAGSPRALLPEPSRPSASGWQRRGPPCSPPRPGPPHSPSTCSRTAGPGPGVGMVVVAISVSAMAGIPPQHAGLASGFLMTGHEVGAALGVAVLSAVATAAGSLTSPGGVVTGFGNAFVAAAVIAGLLAVVAYRTMPSTAVAGGAGHMHLH